MARPAAILLVFTLLSCRDPFDFEPGDPTKPDPPSPPVLTLPGNGWRSDDYGYPQDVDFAWQPVSKAEFYQIEAFRDSLLTQLVASNSRLRSTTASLTLGSWGFYYWRVRAASRSWNNYTDWSAPFRFVLPCPTR